MPPHVVALVMLAALLHAVWNAIVKAGDNAFFTTVLVTAAGALFSAAALPLLPPPARESWFYLLASSAIHFFYYQLMAAAYRHGDMSHAYPLMRGTAPLLVVFVSIPLLGETLNVGQYCAIALICGGIFGIYLAAGRASTAATGYALLTALTIACFTLVDGQGVRRSGSPFAYTMWLFILNTASLLAWTLARQGRALAAYTARFWRQALIGGAGALGAYGLSLWAMTMAPVAAVAALRECSILFAAAIAALFLKEKIGPRRSAAIAMIAAGAALMRFA